MIKKIDIIALIAIIIFSIGIVSKEFENDLYYTIAVGEQMDKTGIDMKEHLSWHENLRYEYPHWLFDKITYNCYKIAGFDGIYIMVVLLTIILGMSIYICLYKLEINKIISLITAIITLSLMQMYMTARAQIFTYILFLLEIYFIERFLKNKEKKYAVFLFIISVLIANLHCATWPMFFIFFMPYIFEYIISFFSYEDNAKRYLSIYQKRLKNELKRKHREEKIKKYNKEIEYYNKYIENKKNEKRIDTYKIKINRNDNVKTLIIIMIICAFGGLLTPLRLAPYTYLVKTYMGVTTKYISEHAPLTIMEQLNAIVIFILIISCTLFIDVKVKLKDFFMLLGLSALSLYSRRQLSLLILISALIIPKLVQEYMENNDKSIFQRLNNLFKSKKTLLIFFIIIMIISIYNYFNISHDYIREEEYPIEAVNYIKNNIDIDNMKLFNEYKIGGYLLFKGIPVFYDSRADLYDSSFNGKEVSIFEDGTNAEYGRCDYSSIFNKYGITHVLAKKNQVLYIILEKDRHTHLIYEDEYFSLYSVK